MIAKAKPLLQKAIEDQLINGEVRDNILRDVLAQLGKQIKVSGAPKVNYAGEQMFGKEPREQSTAGSAGWTSRMSVPSRRQPDLEESMRFEQKMSSSVDRMRPWGGEKEWESPEK